MDGVCTSNYAQSGRRGEQLALFPASDEPGIDWTTVDAALVCVSGGKDSMASVFAILDEGCPRDRIILVHQRVDGAPGEDRGGAPPGLWWDWPVTETYVQAFADHLGLPLYWQWREGGLSRELFRENAIPAPVHFRHAETDSVLPTVGAKPNTRRKFPAQSASLMTRWCSASVKIDPLARAITHELSWQGTMRSPKTLCVVTGERREESAARARYARVQDHKTSTRARRVIQYRPVLDWSEHEIWSCLREHAIRPHPAYIAGFSRCSCRGCIFLTDALWARLRAIDPATVDAVSAAEKTLRFTVSRDSSLVQRLARVSPAFLSAEERETGEWALSPEMFPGIDWSWPSG